MSIGTRGHDNPIHVTKGVYPLQRSDLVPTPYRKREPTRDQQKTLRGTDESPFLIEARNRCDNLMQFVGIKLREHRQGEHLTRCLF